jgi:hypothetical protein
MPVISNQEKKTSMKVRKERRVVKPPPKDQRKFRSARTRARSAKWEVIDDKLDEALRHTFPASDAVSIVQNSR